MSLGHTRALTASLRRAVREVNSWDHARLRGVTSSTKDLSPQVLKFLKKMSQGTKGGVNLGFLRSAIAAMDGWSMSDEKVVVSLKGINSPLWDLLKQWVEEGKKKGVVRYTHGASTKKEPFKIGFEERTSEEDAQKHLDELRKHAKIVASAPRAGTLGDVFITKPSPPKWNYSSYVATISDAWSVLPGWEFRAANGAKITLAHPMGYGGKLENPTGMKLARFWTWAYKNGLKESAAAALAAMDEEEVQRATLPKSQQHRIRREFSAEVEKVLNQLVDRKYQKVVASLAKGATEVLDRFMTAHDEYAAAEKEKGNNWPRYSTYDYFKGRKDESGFKQAVDAAIEPVKRYSDLYRRKSDWKAVLQKWATHMADQSKQGFLDKNNAKLTRIVKGKGNLKGAKVLWLDDSPWDYGGEIRFEFEDGSSFNVRNKTVYKISSLGRWFLQFPTTFHDVVLPNGKKMTGVSEKAMLERFAGVRAG